MLNPHAQLKKDVANLKKEFITFKKEHSQRALVTAMKDVAAAIREGKGGNNNLTPAQQAKLDELTALMQANDDKINAGAVKEPPEGSEGR